MMTRSLLCLTALLAFSPIGFAQTLDGYTLTGIVHDPNRVSVAILEHRDGTFLVLREGETTALGKVSQIDRHSVIFVRPEEHVSMSLEYGVERFAPGGARLLGSADAPATGSVAGSADRSAAVSTEFKHESRVVAVRGSAQALSALIGSAASGAGFSGSNAAASVGGNSGTSGKSGTASGKSSGGGGSGSSDNNAPKELGIALARVFDLPQTMEVVRVNAAPVESVSESFSYIQSEVEFGNTVTLFTHGIPPSNRIYLHPDSPGG